MSLRLHWSLQLAVVGQLSCAAVQADTVTNWNETAQEAIVSSDQHDELRARAVTGPSTVAVIRRQSSSDADKLELEGVSEWLRARFSPSELEALQVGDVTVEAHLCGCYDKPKRHFPYRMVVINTPKGDLVARPENREVSVGLTPLAFRRDNQYCDVDAENRCYGPFSDPCDFSDFRYGPLLSIFFPTCMSEEPEPRATDTDAWRVH